MARAYDVPATWADRLADMRSATIPGGHFFIDTAPGERPARFWSSRHDLDHPRRAGRG
ncbi:MAG: hypothetical protein R3D46_06275 [Defluviimonas denitrificans]